MLFACPGVGKSAPTFFFRSRNRLDRILAAVTSRFGLPALSRKLVDRGANLFDFGVAEFDGVHDRFFFYFFRAGLDHHNAFGRADDHDVQKALAHFVVGRIDDEVVR